MEKNIMNWLQEVEHPAKGDKNIVELGMVEKIVQKLKEELNQGDVKVIATGGLSEIVASESTVIDVVDRTLTLRGLYLLYKMNAPAV